MNDNITLEEETALLSEGHLEAQQGHLLQLLTPVLMRLNTNMTAMNESLKRLHNVDKHGNKEAESASKRPRHSPELGICREVNDLLTEGQTAQDKNSNGTESQDDMLDDIAQALDEAERTAEPVSEKPASHQQKLASQS